MEFLDRLTGIKERRILKGLNAEVIPCLIKKSESIELSGDRTIDLDRRVFYPGPKALILMNWGCRIHFAGEYERWMSGHQVGIIASPSRDYRIFLSLFKDVSFLDQVAESPAVLRYLEGKLKKTHPDSWLDDLAMLQKLNRNLPTPVPVKLELAFKLVEEVPNITSTIQRLIKPSDKIKSFDILYEAKS